MFKKSLVLGFIALFLGTFSGWQNASAVDMTSNKVSTSYFKISPNTPGSKVNVVDVNNGTENIPILSFDIKTLVMAKVTEVSLNAEVTGDAPTLYHLYQGDTEVASVAGSDSVSFSNLSIPNSGVNNYNIKADYSASTANGSSLKLNVASVSLQNDKGRGFQASGNAEGNKELFYHASSNLSFNKSNYYRRETPEGHTTYIRVVYDFSVTPEPGQMDIPSYDDYDLFAESMEGGEDFHISNKVVLVKPTPSGDALEAGKTYNVILSAVYAKPPVGTYTFKLLSAKSTVQDANSNDVEVFQDVGLDQFLIGPVVAD